MAGMKASPTKIVILGGGYVGMYTALRLQNKLKGEEASVTVIDPQPHMTYQPFLPEAAAGSIEPRHVVVPLRRTLKNCHVLTGRVAKVEHANRKVSVDMADGHTEELDYDILVVALGSVARTLPIPGLAEQGNSFKTVGEAIFLRNHVLSKMDEAASMSDGERRKRLLTFMVVGGGYAGIEALAELEDMARYATRYYKTIAPSDMKWVLVEATNRVMPEVSPRMGVYTVERLEERGIKVHLETRVDDMTGGDVRLSDGTAFASDTIVWTAGVKANPVLAETDLPLDERGRVRCTADLRVEGMPEVWAAGDCASVPDLSKVASDPEAKCSPSAQHAVRQAKQLADNVIASLRSRKIEPYRHKYAGSVASLGLYKGVADVYGIKLKGFPAWFMHRTYHVSRMPTFNRKARIVIDWTLALLFRREVISMGQIQEPKAEFARAAK
ncbi:NAD(P)/FAD-dependent oxidoreductase [Actinoalloteichus hymeniacidonis]|uniref:NADH dehydrogenase, FAD-containing subunit n=1 Tax=Actinoalloteichus hymeniacidonis TaxID=340345 RepID=A0AAC9HMK3_9PSEU|nr:NAD(P)/FAD-dependent oxidoreductase [Actinoalloteichus hymeniacidonis]AOS61595.1 NADH dehydrogenase, FAD-containing subunit [Actinoalloteichus hymeniacidonis]MBB5910395.1 NADH dehydrogenase [Actinoalloteichus hymeniacidonis]